MTTTAMTVLHIGFEVLRKMPREHKISLILILRNFPRPSGAIQARVHDLTVEVLRSNMSERETRDLGLSRCMVGQAG